eukprot:115709-Alexandrium_andersonii.AAC.1
MHRLVRVEHVRQPPAHGPLGGRRKDAPRPGPPGVRCEALHFPAGAGRALSARASHERQLLERA